MFTGIIEATAPILSLTGKRLTVARPPAFDDIRPGSSIAVNGCCLTVAELTPADFTADLTEETLRRTTCALLTSGDAVNLERAVRAGDRLDGHVVQGHVETTGEVLRSAGELLEIRIQKEFMKNVFKKGSIAIDGVSLTVADIAEDVVRFAIVPLTADRTIIGGYVPGRRVNVETDVLTRGPRHP